MNLIEAKSEADASIEAGNAVLLVSGSGIGKSQIMRQMFLERRERDAKKGISWGNDNKYADSLVGDICRNTRAYENDWN